MSAPSSVPRLLLLSLALSPTACASYQLGAPPAPPPANASAAVRCVAERQLTLSTASGTVQLMNQTTSDGTYMYVQGRSVSGSGYTFYRGSTSLDVDAGLEELGDPGLRQSYEARRSQVAGAKTQQAIARPTWIVLMAGGIAATLVGITQLKADSKGSIETKGLVLTGAGLGGMLLAIPFLYLDYAANADAASYDLQGKVYMPGDQEGQRLEAALLGQRRRAEQACGLADASAP